MATIKWLSKSGDARGRACAWTKKNRSTKDGTERNNKIFAENTMLWMVFGIFQWTIYREIQLRCYQKMSVTAVLVYMHTATMYGRMWFTLWRRIFALNKWHAGKYSHCSNGLTLNFIRCSLVADCSQKFDSEYGANFFLDVPNVGAWVCRKRCALFGCETDKWAEQKFSESCRIEQFSCRLRTIKWALFFMALKQPWPIYAIMATGFNEIYLIVKYNYHSGVDNVPMSNKRLAATFREMFLKWARSTWTKVGAPRWLSSQNAWRFDELSAMLNSV